MVTEGLSFGLPMKFHLLPRNTHRKVPAIDKVLRGTSVGTGNAGDKHGTHPQRNNEQEISNTTCLKF